MSARAASGAPPAHVDLTGDGRVPDPDRRFYAFALDRLLAYLVDVAVAIVATRTLLAHHRVLPGVLLIVGAVLLVELVLAVVQGVTGTSPGKHLTGLRLVSTSTGRPIGVGRAVVRALVVGLAALPFGFGLVALAWTALTDRSRLRRGWHDRLASSLVVDLRPEPESEPVVDDAPRPVVNLTAMRLAPAHRLPAAAAVPARAATVVRPRHAATPTPGRPPGASWTLAFDTGERVPVDRLVLVGRQPDPRLGEQGARLVAIPSADLSVSKTHLEVVVAADGALVATDRGSTNGSTLVRRGASRHLTPGRPSTLLDGDLVILGDRRMRVEARPSEPT